MGTHKLVRKFENSSYKEKSLNGITIHGWPLWLQKTWVIKWKLQYKAYTASLWVTGKGGPGQSLLCP